MNPHIGSSTETRNNANHCECNQLLWIVRKFHCETCKEHGCQCVGFLKPHGKKSEKCCTTNSSKETTPIISHCKICGSYFYTEEDASNRSCKTRCNLKVIHIRKLLHNLMKLNFWLTPTAHAAASISVFRDSFSKIP